jgi:molybdenum cofactor cytidylyltransferase
LTTQPSNAARVAAIVLAAGASRRMGKNKLLLLLEGEPLVRRACRRALAAGLNPLVVVLGHDSARVQAQLHGLECRFAFNADVSGPMSGSLHRGLECLSADTDAAVVMRADMVNVTEHLLRAMVAAAQSTSAPLVTSRYGSPSAAPVLFRREVFSELLATTGESCGRTVIERYRAQVLFVDAPLCALVDIDTPEEFAML